MKSAYKVLPKTLTTVAVSSTLFVIAGLFYQVWISAGYLNELQTHRAPLVENIAVVVRLNEKLSFSLRSYLDTGEKSWLEKYDDYKAPLNETLSEIPIFLQGIEELDIPAIDRENLFKAEAELIENAARSGFNESNKIMSQFQYDKQFYHFQETLFTLSEVITRSENDFIEKYDYYSKLIFYFLFILIPAVLICWFILIRTFSRNARDKMTADIELLRRKLELEELNSKLSNALKTKTEFLANMSHEIRTPLNAVNGMVELLKELNLENKGKEYLKVLSRSSGTLLELINDILDISKIESGELKFEKIPFSMTKTVDTVTLILKEKALKRGNSLNVEIIGHLPDRVIGDPGRIKQVLLNLLGNAIKFTKDGKITVSVHVLKRDEENCLINLSVKDTGIGISKNALTFIFNRFTQADGSTTRRYGGTGLGLAICEELVRGMGGKLTVESKIHIGSEFSFTLKFHAMKVTEQFSETIPTPKIDYSGMKILYVDDSDDNLSLVKHFTAGLGLTLTLAENGKEALEMAKVNQFDLILLDMQMPIMDGYTMAKKYRRWELNHRHARTPITALTASVLPEEKKRAIDSGCDFHVPKPFQKKTLLDHIGEHSKKNKKAA